MSRLEVIVKRSAVGKLMGRAGRRFGIIPSVTGMAEMGPDGGGSVSGAGSAGGAGCTGWESPVDEQCSRTNSAPRSRVRERVELSNHCAIGLPWGCAAESWWRGFFVFLQISALWGGRLIHSAQRTVGFGGQSM